MTWSLLGALAASVCFGVGSVLQALAARATTATAGVDPGLLLRLTGQWRFLAGIGLDLLGFLLELAALRSLPLFVVQAIIASSLAVTAVTAGLIMKIRLLPAEWAAIGVVCAGLALLGLAAGKESPDPVPVTIKWVLLGSVILLGGLGMAAGRLTGRARALTLGAVAGLGFSVVAMGARALTGFAPGNLVRDPAAYALALGGVVAILFFATALQRGSVTTATAAVVIAETVVPAALGVWFFGDTTRHPVLAITGFVLAVAGALALARFGEPGVPPTVVDSPTPQVELSLAHLRCAVGSCRTDTRGDRTPGDRAIGLRHPHRPARTQRRHQEQPTPRPGQGRRILLTGEPGERPPTDRRGVMHQ
ncbi:MAG: hypothetical protein ABIS86_22165 [Streptosporangiaceae bacterium]